MSLEEHRHRHPKQIVQRPVQVHTLGHKQIHGPFAAGQLLQLPLRRNSDVTLQDF